MSKLSPLPEEDREAIREILSRRTPRFLKDLDQDGKLDEGQFARIQDLLLNEFMSSRDENESPTAHALRVELLLHAMSKNKAALLGLTG